MMRSTLSSPVGLSNSYLTLEPRGISMMAWKSRGTSLPGETSCQAWSTVGGLVSELRKKHFERSPRSGQYGLKDFRFGNCGGVANAGLICSSVKRTRKEWNRSADKGWLRTLPTGSSSASALRAKLKTY